MNILHRIFYQSEKIQVHNILGFDFILETNDSYFDIVIYQDNTILNIYETNKNDLNKDSLDERIFTLNECYEICLVNNNITLIQGEKIKFFDGEELKLIGLGNKLESQT